MRVSSEESDLITRDGGPVRASGALRDKVAIFSDGRCLVSRSHSDDVDVLSVIALARRLGVKTKAPEYVDLGSLRSFYSRDGKGGVWQSASRSANDDTTMQREVQDLLSRAAAAQASDIHIVVEGEAASVRVRVDGELRPMGGGGAGATVHWRADHGRQICMTAYAMAAEGGTADANYDPFSFQAGRIMTGLPEGVQAVRLQFNPVGYSGRHLVMRLLYCGHAAGSSIRDLGFSAAHVETLIEFSEGQTGIVVISGPTGSGKTTTLERLMRRIVEKNPGESILSVEDPPEYRIPGVVQLPVSNMHNDEDRDGAYTEAIAAALRSDPDRIMIGEVRTRAAAHHAFEAAMTGHQVLTTVHANDALGIVPRLLDIGVETYKLRDPSLVSGLVAQRLVRRLCQKCRRQTSISSGDLPADLALRLQRVIEDRPIWLPGAGCPDCRQGYAGRTVVAEIIRPDQKLLDLLCLGERQEALRYWLSSLVGRPFSHHALEKISEGLIDPIQAEYRIGKISI
ncbi:ATPase, T2SS/T4P/T4SS family [Telmatospirillum sp.]|uniref:GspE/PulE family protein n=1 Tax=Telmatospirillum sp. TaxID=2079197 RepID=UPI0028424A9F|nr:ATPase, T2SS/T4P/T4SS family [Telmatospirillum sp.]MDR3438185.1 ATPase, T2SS/T4P/T4SS family [Telmatospirillum sp.]